MVRDKESVLNSVLRSFENDKEKILEDINWIINSSNINKDEFKKLVTDLSVVVMSIEQVEYFLEQINPNSDDLDFEDDISDSADS